MTVESITVVTVTRGRCDLLQRALASIEAQCSCPPVQHLVLVDDCDATASMLADRAMAPPAGGRRWLLVRRLHGEEDGPARLGYLRNLAVRIADHPWLAFLDDDNTFEPDHLATLSACVDTTGAKAVHSQRRLFWRDGSPYQDPLCPWTRDPTAAAGRYRELVEAGVFSPGDNVVRDRVDRLDAMSPVHMVDMGEWLIARDLLLQVGFREHYDADDWREVVPEDNKLLRDLVALRVPIASSQRPTLHYYLGGYSNDFRCGAAGAAAPVWRPP